MITEKFRNALEEYHRKKWFPQTYADPFGEFIDYISEGMIADLVEAWRRNKIGSQLDAAYYLLRILPQIQHRELLRDYRSAFSRPISARKIYPEFILYYTRSLPEEESRDLWNDFREWNEQWETVLSEWNSTNLEFEKAHSEFFSAYFERLNFPQETQLRGIENRLRDTRELFAWQLQKHAPSKNYREMLRQLDFQRWKTVADWRDLTSLAKSVRETCSISKAPKMQPSEEPSAQITFPVAPPTRVIIEQGTSSGLFDAMRFLIEYGKGLFYSGMNPELKAEERICGDPALPWFWGNVFASFLTEAGGVKHFIGLHAEGLDLDATLLSEAAARHESMLALYRTDAMRDLKNLQDHYAARWELAIGFEPPRFQYLFDLNRSMESFFKAIAAERAKEAIQTFRTKYGTKWFNSQQWSKRVKDYFWEGFRLTLQDLMNDL